MTVEAILIPAEGTKSGAWEYEEKVCQNDREMA